MSAQNLRATMPGDREPVDSLQPIIDQDVPAAGRWILRVVDTDDDNVNAIRQVRGWGVNLTRRADNAWRLPSNLVVDGSVDAQTLCRIEKQDTMGKPYPVP